jgi:hypothetical protein
MDRKVDCIDWIGIEKELPPKGKWVIVSDGNLADIMLMAHKDYWVRMSALRGAVLKWMPAPFCLGDRKEY